MTASTPIIRNGCKRNFRRQLRRLADFKEGMLGANGLIFRQVTPSLPHDPDRHALNRLEPAGAQK